MARFFAALLVLSLITVLLLGYAVQFFSAMPVRMQISAWVSSLAPSSSSGSLNSHPAPLHTFTAIVVDATLTPAVVPSQTQDPGSAPPRGDATQEPRVIVPTTPPIIQVIEEPPPDGNLVIPALDIDQPLVPITVRDQIWDVDELGRGIGWLQTTGTHPRDDLAMVLIGHVTLPPYGGPGPFLYLQSLKPGEIIEYRSFQGTFTYKVKSHTVVNPNEVENLYRPGGSSLLLVTCAGYNPAEWQYDHRLIVEAELVSVKKNAYE